MAKIAQGKVKFVIGTHALIQKEATFATLGLVIVDEQHRFGVEQRAHLLRGEKKKLIPHLLSMTATPIPRTLALTLYGDLDLSLLKELPKGRKKIMTRVIPPAKREDAYGFIRKHVQEGRQVFVICPLIEESKVLEVRAATQEYEKLSRKVFPDLRVAMLHGRMKPKEKEETMKKFKDGSVDVLVSTAVVEVGIDVPNATIMMIEGAERFGLAQLHQFRGRVGRGEHQSYCLLFTDSPAKATNQRLKALVESDDGFALAEKDLAIRGPGEFFGTQQSGLPDLAMTALKDPQLIEETQAAVRYFFEKSSLKEHPGLRQKLSEFTKEVHWE
jgi:ATP-dependent DNA helicase RecG